MACLVLAFSLLVIKNIMTEFIHYEELYEAYIDCRRTKRTSLDSLQFEIDENKFLYELWTDLNSKKYEVGPSYWVHSR
jgi:hypothetical protein